MKSTVKGLAAAALIMTTFAASVPPTSAGFLSTSVCAESVLSAPTGFKTKSDKSDMTVKWNKVEGADAYRVYIKRPWDESYSVFKTVKSAKVVIDDLFTGEKISILVAPLEKNADGSYTEGETAAYTKTYKGKNFFWLKNGVMGFDKALLGKTPKQIKKLTGIELDPEKSDWVPNGYYAELLVNDDMLVQFAFDNKKKLVSASISTDEIFNSKVKKAADKIFGKGEKRSSKSAIYYAYTSGVDSNYDEVCFDLFTNTWDDGSRHFTQIYYNKEGLDAVWGDTVHYKVIK